MMHSADANQSLHERAPMLIGHTRYEPRSDVKNIMITGGAGFIGSWVTRHLTMTYADNYKVVCFDKLDYCASMNNVRQLQNQANFAFHKGDLLNPGDILACLQEHNIDTILHFAAQSHVDLSFGNSYDFTSNNVYGTHVLLECVRTYGKITRFIHVSTDEVYGEVSDASDDLLEDAVLAPTNPYAASKAAAEMLVNAYYNSFKVPVIMVRSNNVYGPHQFPEKVIPKFTLMLQRRKRLTLHGNGNNTRRYLYGGDAADAFDTVLHRGTIGQVYNVGSSDEVSNIDLCYKLLGLFNLPNTTEADLSAQVTHTPDRPFNDHRYAVDGSRLKTLGWSQKTDFTSGLKTTVEWYEKFGNEWWGDVESRLEAFPEQEKKPEGDVPALTSPWPPTPSTPLLKNPMENGNGKVELSSVNKALES